MLKLIEPKIQIEKSRQLFSNRNLRDLIVPLIIEQLLILLVGIADTLMVSYAGEAAVSGVSLVNQLNTVFILVFTALASGGAVVASQYVGNKDKKNGVLASSQLVMITTFISIILMGVAIIFRRELLTLLFGRVESEVMQACLTYLIISAFSFPALAIYNSCAGLFRSMSKTKTIMYVSIIMNVINVVGNFIGIFVLHAGVAGVAYPSLISRVIAAVILLAISLNKNNTIYVRIKDIFKWSQEMIRRILNIAIPNGIENGLFQLSKVALSSIVAMFGTSQIAANGVAQSFWSMAALFCLAMGPAFITVIGQCMGAGDVEAADYYMKKLLRITYLGGIIWNIVFFIVTPLILQLYSLSSDTIYMIIILCLIHNLFNALLCPIASSLSNGLRACGDVKYTMYTSIFSTVVCRVILSIIFGIWMNLGVIGIALAMVGDWAIKSALIAKRYYQGKWKQFKVI
ncbi:MATE family efflux transporter [Beduini massiliensis]|uniref:MATE family efflux transporter n=1 Tax=Beduini massiliensis TaxID=1585974 RepID=UPI00059AA082|nr:MATE family efflux transporter [Beduini massiliensis]